MEQDWLDLFGITEEDLMRKKSKEENKKPEAKKKQGEKSRRKQSQRSCILCR